MWQRLRLDEHVFSAYHLHLKKKLNIFNREFSKTLFSSIQVDPKCLLNTYISIF